MDALRDRRLSGLPANQVTHGLAGLHGRPAVARLQLDIFEIAQPIGICGLAAGPSSPGQPEISPDRQIVVAQLRSGLLNALYQAGVNIL